MANYNATCYQSSTSGCGNANSLINTGGYYWYATPHGGSSVASGMHWSGRYKYVSAYSTDCAYGIRPVIRLAAKVVVTGGSGTAASPYTMGV